MRIWPAKADGRDVVCLALSSPDGRALVEAPAAPLNSWLDHTLRLVPPGTEADRLGLDDGLSRLLAATPGDDQPDNGS